MSMLGRISRAIFCRLCSRLRVGSLALTTPDGRPRVFGSPDAALRGELDVRDESLFSDLISQGDWGLGWGFVKGKWDSSDPYRVALVLMLNEEVFRAPVRWLGRLSPSMRAVVRAGQANLSPDRATRRRTVSEAYDVGNDFFRWTLGPSMTYTPGIWDRPDASLEEAQENKLRIVAEKAAIEPQHRVLDIGSGWGTLCGYLHAKTGASVKGIALAREQVEWAQKHHPDCEFEYLDYQDLTGSYDRIVSVGMAEHVGRPGWEGFLRRVCDCLAPGGRFVLDTMQSYDGILMQSPSQRWNSFTSVAMPNADVPSMSNIVAAALATGMLRVVHTETFGLHYARTAQCWLENLVAHREQIVRAYSEQHYRIYLYAWSMGRAAMETGLTSVQVVLEKKPFGSDYALGSDAVPSSPSSAVASRTSRVA